MASRGDYEKRRGPKGHNHNQPLNQVRGDIVCVVSVANKMSAKPTHVAVRVDVDFIALPIMCHIPSADALDVLIDSLISARNNVWPNN